MAVGLITCGEVVVAGKLAACSGFTILSGHVVVPSVFPMSHACFDAYLDTHTDSSSAQDRSQKHHALSW